MNMMKTTFPRKGFFTVNSSANSNLFFWFFLAQNGNKSAPLLLWLQVSSLTNMIWIIFFSKKCHQLVIVIHGLVQGGPGASSMFGALKEHGPFLADVELDGEPFVKHNPYSWSGNHSVIYVDNPVGTGFSFTDDPDDFPSFVEETTEVNIFESKATLKKKLSENTSISGLVQPSAAVLPAVS